MTFGTPHVGSKVADWAEPARQFVNLLGVATNPSLLKTLKSGSETLATLQKGYLNMLRERAKTEFEVKIVCFFEGKSTKRGLMTVGKVRCWAPIYLPPFYQFRGRQLTLN